MTTNISKKGLLFLLSMLMIGYCAQAGENGEKRVAIRAERIFYYGPIVVQQPYLADSTNVMGKEFSKSKLPKVMPYDNEMNSNYVELTSEENIFKVDVPAFAEETEEQYHFFKLNLLPATYGKGYLEMECNAPFEVYLDGQQVMSGNGAKGVVDSIKPKSKKITLKPQQHKVAIRMVVTPKDSLKNIALRIGYAPIREGAIVEFRTDNKRYIDLPFMISSTSLNSTTLSPSGTYATLKLRSVEDNRVKLRSVLLKNGKKIRNFEGMAAGGSWMPKQDKIYYSEYTEMGKTLFSYDPETEERAVLHSNIPAGNFILTPGETGLIYYPSDNGPGYNKTLDLFVTPKERAGKFRDRQFLAFFDLKSGVLRQLTFGNRSTELSDMRRDDAKLIFSISTPTPTQSPFYRRDFYELDLRNMRVDTLFSDPTGINSVHYTSDDNFLVVAGSANAFDEIGSVLPKGTLVNTYDTQLFLFDKRDKSVKPLTKEFDRNVVSFALPAERFEVYFMAEIGDRKQLFKCNLRSGKIEQLSKSEDYVKQIALASYGDAITYIGQSGLTSDRFYAVDTKRNRETLLYDLSATKMKDVDPGTMKDWNYTAPDGTIIQGRYYLPPNFDPNKKYPMIVYYYAGTNPVKRMLDGTYSPPMYAALGYVVYSMNPSGCTGYGQEFAARHVNAWGERTADEIIGSVKQFCATHPFVDSSKIGCIGASYGGFMTQYLQTKTDIFAAAVSHAGISSISSYWGDGYWGVGYSTVASTHSYPWNNRELYVDRSPLFSADKINTPLLLVHGLKDTNVPVGESWQMFNALQILGKEVAFIGVYGQNHHITDRKSRYEWTSAIMAWFAKYLQDDSTWWDDLFPENNL